MRRLSTLARFAAVLAALAAGIGACREPAAVSPHFPTICLMTDYGLRDSFVAELKGAMLSVNPNIRIVDLTHEIEPYNIPEGAYLLRNSAREFPPGSVFVAVVDPGVGTARNSVLIQTERGKYFVGPDNGLFSLVLKSEGFAKAWKLNNPNYFRPGEISETFHGRDIYGPVAAHLVSGVSPDKLGESIRRSDLKFLDETVPTVAGPNLVVRVLHIDRFGNVITNLAAGFTQNLEFDKLAKITIGEGKAVRQFSAPMVRTFAEGEKGRLILLYGSQGFLEIAINQGNAAKELGVKVGDTITIRP